MGRVTITLAMLICAGNALAAQASTGKPMEEMVVTGVRTDTPLTIMTDPKHPRQPVPASDGADYLKTIPGFSVIRKGGTDGDPVFRGMAGSRVAMLLDGQVVLGGCSNRMDPPTAYISPETFDRIQVIKGPQTVQYGPGNAAGVVLFEEDTARPSVATGGMHLSLLTASANRRDEVMDATWSTPEYTIRTAATHAAAGNYSDGDGVKVHSRYDRWNAQVKLAWTPDDDTRIELGIARGNGEAAYADRAVDGSKFDRQNYSLKITRGPFELQTYYNYVDHVMDNYTLRESTGMMSARVAMNPDRKTTGGKVTWKLDPSDAFDGVVGIDWVNNHHGNRYTMNEDMMPYENMARIPDARFAQVGGFGEFSWNLDAGRRLVSGMRVDRWEAKDLRDQVALSMMMSLPNPTAQESRKQTLHSEFIRLEQGFDLVSGMHTTFYAGVGRNARFPDYWEMIAKETADSTSAFDVRPEITTQLDTGVIFRQGGLSGSVSAFVNRIDDFLMIQTGYMKHPRSTTITRNVDVRSWGLEADVQYRLDAAWRIEASLASVRGTNDTDNSVTGNSPLPQLPPLETHLGVFYDDSVWSAGLLYRVTADQNRIDIGKGNIVGQDIGPTAGTNVVSANAGWRPAQGWLITAGVDNLLDQTYAEHISRAGAAVAGFTQTTRVNEPGRTFWLKAQFSM